MILGKIFLLIVAALLASADTTTFRDYDLQGSYGSRLSTPPSDIPDILVEDGSDLTKYVPTDEREIPTIIDKQIQQAAKIECEPDLMYEALPFLVPNSLAYSNGGWGKVYTDVCLDNMLATGSFVDPTSLISADASMARSLLLPDLQTLPPSDIVIQFSWFREQKLLRFSNSVLNAGPGALELQGEFNPESGNTKVTQHIYTEEGAIVEVEVGDFVYHPGHNHWHFEDFARYELWSLGNYGELDALVVANEKVGFCLRDNTPSRLPGMSFQHVYIFCGRELQGISAGWIDTYEYDIDDQVLEITDLPDGVYALRSIANPSELIWELDVTNNEAIVIIEITGLRVSVVEG